jgi:hypothetical protein
MEKLLTKSFDRNVSDHELERGCHAINFCSWSRLRPFLAQASNNREEDIQGVRVIKEGLEIILK